MVFVLTENNIHQLKRFGEKPFSVDDEGGLGELRADGEGPKFASETDGMMRRQREQEQSGHRKLGKVNQRNHDERDPSGPGQEKIAGHPLLNSQRFDGVDPNVSPLPNHPDDLAEFENLRNEQKLQKQKKLDNALANQATFNPTPNR